MKEPWDQPDYLSWRVYADFLLETQAPAAQIKRAVKYALGLKERPKLVLVVQLVYDARNDEGVEISAGQQSGIQRGSAGWDRDVFTNQRWVTPRWYRKSMQRLYGQESARLAESKCIATPADFPRMAMAESPLLGWQLTLDFYRKASENIGVRCHRGEVLVRFGRSARNEWVLWEGV